MKRGNGGPLGYLAFRGLGSRVMVSSVILDKKLEEVLPVARGPVCIGQEGGSTPAKFRSCGSLRRKTQSTENMFMSDSKPDVGGSSLGSGCAGKLLNHMWICGRKTTAVQQCTTKPVVIILKLARPHMLCGGKLGTSQNSDSICRPRTSFMKALGCNSSCGR